MLLVVDPTMPSNLRHSLVDRMAVVFPVDFKPVDTQAEGLSSVFPSMHYTWYNRYSIQVSLSSYCIQSTHVCLCVGR